MKATATRVLIIDDDPLIRTLLVSALRKECFVAVAAEGSEGFTKALDLKPDIAVIDVNMPGWDGLKTLEAFRGDASLQNVKIIMLTADASMQTVTAAVRGGANDYLIKTSFSKADFYRKLNRLVSGTIQKSPLLNEPRGAELDSNSSSVKSADSSLPTAPVGSSVGGPHCSAASERSTVDASSSDASENSTVVASRLQEMIDAWD